jgi:hypothetical protein
MEAESNRSMHLCAGCHRTHEAAVWFYNADALGAPQTRLWLCSTRFHQLLEPARLYWSLSVWDVDA